MRTLSCKRETLEMATPIVLPRCLGDKVGILPSQRRLPGPGTDHQFSTNRLGAGDELPGAKFRRLAIT